MHTAEIEKDKAADYFAEDKPAVLERIADNSAVEDSAACSEHPVSANYPADCLLAFLF